jgi:hypothetical protein
MPRDLPTSFWVSALIRRAELGGAFATIIRKGDADRGDVLLKVRQRMGAAQLYAPAFVADGAAAFETVFRDQDVVEEDRVDAAIAARVRADRDLWVIEVEDRDGRTFLVEPIR